MVVVTMSLGLDARPAGMFSAAAAMAITLIAAFASAAALTVPQHRRGAAHVELHLAHARARLQVDAAGVERDALAMSTVGAVSVAAAAVVRNDHLRRLVAAPGDGEVARHCRASAICSSSTTCTVRMSAARCRLVCSAMKAGSQTLGGWFAKSFAKARPGAQCLRVANGLRHARSVASVDTHAAQLGRLGFLDL